MKLAVTMYSFNDYVRPGKMTIEEVIDVCAGYGIDAVDLLEYYWKDKARQVKEVPKLMKDKGLEIGAFCVGNDFLLSLEEREKQLDYVKEGLFTAAALGAKRLRIFGGWKNPDGVSREAQISMVSEYIGKLVDTAKSCDVTMVIENHGGMPATSSDAKAIINNVNSPYLRLNFDLGNFYDFIREDPMHAAKELYPFVGHIHAKDSIEVEGGKTEQCIVGEGSLPVKECLKFFKEKGYEGYVSLEYEAWAKADSLVGVKKSLDCLKMIYKEL